MLFYLFFIFFVYLFMRDYRKGDLSTDKYSKKLYFGIILIVSVAIFRFDVGNDYPGYYQYIVNANDTQMMVSFPPLAKMIFNISHYIGWPFFFILNGLITYYCIFSNLKKFSANLFIGTLVYVSFFFLLDLCIVFQATAAAIVFWGYRFVKSKSFLKYLIVVIIASMIHESAIVAIFIYLIYNYLKFYQTILLGLLIVLFFNIIVELMIKYNFYGTYFTFIDRLEDISKGSRFIKYAYLLFFLIMGTLDYLHKNLAKNKMMYSILFFGLLLYFLFPGQLGKRVAQYYLLYFCLLIPSVLSKLNVSFKQITIFILVLYFFINIYVATYQSSARSHYVPYQSVLFIDINHPKFRR